MLSLPLSDINSLIAQLNIYRIDRLLRVSLLTRESFTLPTTHSLYLVLPKDSLECHLIEVNSLSKLHSMSLSQEELDKLTPFPLLPCISLVTPTPTFLLLCPSSSFLIGSFDVIKSVELEPSEVLSSVLSKC